MKKFKYSSPFTPIHSPVTLTFSNILQHSINSFKYIIENPVDPTQYAIDLDTPVGKVTLQIRLVEEYPMAIPEMDISSPSHKLEKHDLMKALIQEVTTEK